MSKDQLVKDIYSKFAKDLIVLSGGGFVVAQPAWQDFLDWCATNKIAKENGSLEKEK